jgi:hypothetical protein
VAKKKIKEDPRVRVLQVQLDRFKKFREREKVDGDWKRYLQAYEGEHADQQVHALRRRLGTNRKATTNLIFQQLETIKPILTQNVPVITLAPVLRNEAWTDIAELLNKTINRILMRNDIRKRNVELVDDGLKFGQAFFKMVWDKERNAGHGDICITVPDRRTIYLEPSKDNVLDSNMIFETTTTDILSLLREFPDMTKEIMAVWSKMPGKERGPGPFAFLKEKMKGFSATAPGEAASTETRPFFEMMGTIGEDLKEDIELVEAWFHDPETEEAMIEVISLKTGKKSNMQGLRTKWPDGKLMQFAGSLLFHEQGNKFPGFPYVQYDNYISRTFRGISEIKHIINIQKKHDARDRQLFELLGNMIKNKIFVDSRAQIDAGQFNNAPNGIVYNNGTNDGVRWMDAPSVGGDLMNEGVTGVREVTQGQVPGDIRSGAGVEALQEAADTRLKGKSGEMESTYLQLVRQMLPMIVRFYRLEEHWHAPNEEIKETKEWKRAIGKKELNADMFDITIEAGVNRPRSRIAQEQKIQLLHDREVLDKEYMLEHSQIEDTEEVVLRNKVKWELEREVQMLELEARKKELEAALAGSNQPVQGGDEIGNSL